MCACMCIGGYVGSPLQAHQASCVALASLQRKCPVRIESKAVVPGFGLSFLRAGGSGPRF